MRLSWNRDEDGVVTVYATTPEGIAYDVADFWLRPMMQRIGVPRDVALAQQQRLAERLVEAINSEPDISDEGWECPISHPGCTEDCGAYGCKN